jgi:hypothetical protein
MDDTTARNELGVPLDYYSYKPGTAEPNQVGIEELVARAVDRALALQIGDALRELGHKNDVRDLALIRRIEELELTVAILQRIGVRKPRKWWHLW